MKIAIPVVDEKLCMHFGHCEKFVVLDVDQEKKIVNSREDLTPPPHEPGVIPAWLNEVGANMIIAGGMGSRAQDLFTNNKIDVITGVASDLPEVIVENYLNDRLQTGQNSCDH